jgi:hypothetical protein
MSHSIDAIVDRQFRRWEVESNILRKQGTYRESKPLAHPVITVSRQHGTIGSEIAARLAERFQYTLLHRDIIDRICESTDYSRRLLESLDEHAQSQLTTWVQSMLAGRYVDEGDYVRALLKTIYSIARLGGVVVVGRGSNFVVGLERGFHVRVVAPRDRRVEHLVQRSGMTPRDALHEIDSTDRHRAEFVRRVYGRSTDDPLAYDVVVNAADGEADSIACWLAMASTEKFKRMLPQQAHSS